MKSFILKICVFLVLMLIPIYIVFTQANGHADSFYLRFTTPKQTSLILGTSKAAQGLHPDIINDILSRKDIFNYSFTIIHSPYGPTYLESIKKKLLEKTTDGIFVVTVDPWSLSNGKKDIDNPNTFVELNNCLSNMTWVNSKPNIEYLVKNYNEPYIDLFRKSEIQLHENGWLEVTVTMDSASVNKRISNKVKLYKEVQMANSGFSNTRLDFLLKTIAYLKHHGKVYLVRLPVHPRIMELENTYSPNFEKKIEPAIKEASDYFDMTFLNNDYDYTDGMHLDKESGKQVSKILAKRILHQRRPKK